MRAFVGESLGSKYRKVIRKYRSLRENEGLSACGALTYLVRIVFCRVFRPEECGIMCSYHYIGFRNPEIYRTMFTGKDNAALLPLVNDESALPMLKEKHRLLRLLGDVGRRYMYVPDHSEKEVAAFFSDGGKKEYILKPDAAAGSSGIAFLSTDGHDYVMETADHARHSIDLKTLYDGMKRKNVLVEEYIQQHEQLNAMFCGCVNTMFIHTARLPDGHIEVCGFPYMVFGCGESRYANNGKDLLVGIHEDGTLFSFGFLRREGWADPVKVTRHPDSGIAFDEFHVPYLRQAIQLALDSARKVPQLTYIKWDLAISPNGPVIIEGNGMPGSYPDWQAYSLEDRHIGVKAELTEFLQSLAFSKTLTPQRIREINRTLREFDCAGSPEHCDAVVVLGSARATSRIATALRTFGNNPKMRYILCGGNDSIHAKDAKDPTGEKLSEADYMKQFLLDRGVREDQIVTDNNSRNTRENLEHATEMASHMNVGKVALVSAWFHGRRIRKLLSQCGNLGLAPENVCFVPSYGENARPDNWFRSLYGIKAIYHEWKHR